MGLQQDLSIGFKEPNAVQRFLQSIAATGPGTAVVSKLIAPVDRFAYTMSKGRLTVGRSLGALPVVVLTTTGARSGQQRDTPITAIPFEDELALLGTNFGSGKKPAWAYNLDASPVATIAYNGTSVDVVTRRATETECDTVYLAADRIYTGYASYRRNATNAIPVFILKGRETNE